MFISFMTFFEEPSSKSIENVTEKQEDSYIVFPDYDMDTNLLSPGDSEVSNRQGDDVYIMADMEELDEPHFEVLDSAGEGTPGETGPQSSNEGRCNSSEVIKI